MEEVTTISADIHKLGDAPRGTSIILHCTKALRRYQTFVFEDWLGGFYALPMSVLPATDIGMISGSMKARPSRSPRPAAALMLCPHP